MNDEFKHMNSAKTLILGNNDIRKGRRFLTSDTEGDIGVAEDIVELYSRQKKFIIISKKYSEYVCQKLGIRIILGL